MASRPSLQEILAGAQLPALPQSAVRLMQLAQDPDNGPAEFAVPIEADPGLTGQVLRFVNSSYFGFSREISSVKLAITLVGVRTIKNFALWSAVFSLMPNPKSGPFDLKMLWKDSLRRGLFARRIGQLLGMKDAEDLFAAALLQDMAVPLLAKELPEDYGKLLHQREGGRKRLSKLEREKFGWTHADAAAHMARSWSLPDAFAELIEVHANLSKILAEESLQPSRLAVALSSMLPNSADSTWPEAARFESIFDGLCEEVAQAPALDELFAQVDAEFADIAPILKLPNDGPTLADCYRDALACA